MLTGSFDEFGFDEIITLTGKFNGRLLIWNLPHANLYELHVDKMILHALFVDRKPVKDSSSAFDEIAMLLNVKQGRFEFIPPKLTKCATTYPSTSTASFSMLLLHSMSSKNP